MNHMERKAVTRRARTEGSVLVFSLIILSLMLVTSLTVLSAAVLQQKAALSTGNSTRSFQTADSGIELVLYQIYQGGRLTISDISSHIPNATCSGGIVTSTDGWAASFFQGVNGDVLITDCAASRTLITRVKSKGTTSGTTRAVEVKVKPLGMLGWWKFDDGSGTAAIDSSGNNNNGTLNGVSWVTGKVGSGALSFNFDYVDMGNPTTNSLDLGKNATLETWVKFNSLLPSGNLETFMSKDVGGGNKWFFGLGNNYGTCTVQGLVFHINGPSSVFLCSSSWTPATGTWYHVAVSKSDGNYTFYVNGVAVGTSSTGVSVPTVAADFIVGWSEGNLGLSGSMDDVRVYDSARTAAQIKRDMNGS